MVNDITGERQQVSQQGCMTASSGSEAGADNMVDGIDLAAIAAAMLGFGKRQITDGKLPSKT